MAGTAAGAAGHAASPASVSRSPVSDSWARATRGLDLAPSYQNFAMRQDTPASRATSAIEWPAARRARRRRLTSRDVSLMVQVQVQGRGYAIASGDVKRQNAFALAMDQMPDRKEIPGLSARLREAREHWGGYGLHGLREFSRATGIAYSALAEYERGEKQPGSWALWRIARLSGLSADYLLAGGEKPEQVTPTAHVREAVRALQTRGLKAQLGRVERLLFAERVRFVSDQLERLVFDAGLYLRRLHARSQRLKFDHEQERRELLAEESEGTPPDHNASRDDDEE